MGVPVSVVTVLPGTLSWVDVNVNCVLFNVDAAGVVPDVGTAIVLLEASQSVVT